MKKELLMELIGMLASSDASSSSPSTSEKHKWAGEYVICRSRNEGVNFGKLISAKAGEVELAEAQRLHYFAPLDKSISWYEGVAESGISEDSRISPKSHKIISEDCSLTLCSGDCVKSIKGHKANEQK